MIGKKSEISGKLHVEEWKKKSGMVIWLVEIGKFGSVSCKKRKSHYLKLRMFNWCVWIGVYEFSL